MKTKHNLKPVRKCHDCQLNIGDRCGVYSAPREMWHHRVCPGYKNEVLLMRYEVDLLRHPLNSMKLRRQEAGKRTNAEPHWQGMLPYANR